MRFLPGESGNPAGRPPGALNKKTLAFEAAYEARAEDAVRDIMERSKGGDSAAMRLCMERAVPTGRNRRIAFGLPRIRTPEDAEAAIELVMDGLAEGALTLAEVSVLLGLVERLLGLAEAIAEKKKLRAMFDRRAAERAAVPAPQAAAADVTGDAASAPDADTTQPGGDPAAPLYFPVNHDAERLPDEGSGPRDLPAAMPVSDYPPPAGRERPSIPSAA